MAEKILKKCVIVCSSPDANADYIKHAVNPQDYIIAADGGMEVLNKAGFTPDLFVGDFDSYGGIVPDRIEVIKLNTHKDDTDSMHCACVALERGFKSVLILGGSGGSLSHTYSNYSVLSFLEDNGISAVMSDKDGEVRVLKEGTYSFYNQNGCEFSVFPFGCEKAVVSYIGNVEYPAENLVLTENSSLGKSNVFRSENVRIIIKQGKAVIFNSKRNQ